MSLISPGRSVVSVAIRWGRKSERCGAAFSACEKYHKEALPCKHQLSRCALVAPDATVRCCQMLRRPHLIGMAASIKDLKVWQEAVALAADVVKTARQGARRETK